VSDGVWELVLGDAQEYHADLWRRVGRKRLAEAWGIPESAVPWSLEPRLVPTGYVDFIEQSGRDVLVLELPSELPQGWTPGQVKARLRCGDKIQRVRENPARNADPDEIRMYLRMFERSREEQLAAPNH